MNTRYKGSKVPPTGRACGGKAKAGNGGAGSETATSSSRSTPALTVPSQSSARKRKTPDGTVTLSPAEFAQYQKYLSSGTNTPSASQIKAWALAQKVARDKGWSLLFDAYLC
jgi:hypothetical protein